MDRPEITYPTTWGFRIVGSDGAKIRARVAAVVGDRPYELAPSAQSTKGNYVSLKLELEVRDEVDRDAIFAGLKDDESIKMVI